MRNKLNNRTSAVGCIDVKLDMASLEIYEEEVEYESSDDDEPVKQQLVTKDHSVRWRASENLIHEIRASTIFASHRARACHGHLA